MQIHENTKARVEGRVVVLDHGNGYQLLECGYPETAADMAMRFNAHDALVAACEEMLTYMSEQAYQDPDIRAEVRAVRDRARAALRAARGEAL